MRYRLSFEIHELPKMANGSYGSWQADYHRKLRWRRLVGKCIQGMTPKEPLARARGVFTRFSSVEPDDDGLVHGFKPIRDALTFYGVILDDKRKVLEAEYRWEKASPGKGRIKVEVEEIS
jgi:Holliday junction resolvase RusA-like endonuclease